MRHYHLRNYATCSNLKVSSTTSADAGLTCCIGLAGLTTTAEAARLSSQMVEVINRTRCTITTSTLPFHSIVSALRAWLWGWG